MAGLTAYCIYFVFYAKEKFIDINYFNLLLSSNYLYMPQTYTPFGPSW